MRRDLITAFIIVSTLSGYSQSNTFPETGHVGIGTLTPDNAQGWNRVLNLHGTSHAKLMVTESSGVKLGMYSHSGYNGKIGTESSHDLTFTAGYWNDVMTLTTTGNVGIGTVNPFQTLDIVGGLGFANQNSTDKKLYSPVDGTLEWMTHNSAGEHGFAISHQGNRAVYLNTTGSSYINGGNVGIGTSTPFQTLDILGGLGFANQNSQDKKLYSPVDGTLEWMTHNSAGEHGFAVSHQGNRAVYLNTSGNSYLNGGNVGIGLASPLSKLHIEGNTAAESKLLVRGVGGTNPSLELGSTETGNATEAGEGFVLKYINDVGETTFNNLYTQSENAFKFQSAGTDRFIIKNEGSVGIGSASPLSKLHIEGNTSAGSKLLLRGAGGINPSFELGSTESGTNTEAGEGFVLKYMNDVGETILNNLFAPCENAFRFQSAGTDRFVIKNSGNVGIGTSTPDATLTVKGKIHAEEVKVDLNVPGPDYVFEKDYDLKSLSQVEKFITENKHLPEIPSAKAMKADGISMGDMQMKLLQKIEELTLYMIEQNKESAKQNQIIKEQNERIMKLEKIIQNK